MTFAKLNEVHIWYFFNMQCFISCYHNRECFKCNGVINYKKGLKYYKSSPLLVPWLQHMGKHAPLSLLTP